MAFIDNFLNKITMYRLALYSLAALVAMAIFFGSFGILPYHPVNFVFSTFVILAACWACNTVLAKVFGAIPNIESVYITGFILALLVSPTAPDNFAGIGYLIFVSACAMASKYIFAIGKKHVFNPAAFGVVLGALVLGQPAAWWVAGNLPLLPFVLVGGLLLVRKIRRFDLVISFSVVALLVSVLVAPGNAPITVLAQTLLYSTFFFLALVMLTEPLTKPPDQLSRIIYGAIVGYLFASNLHLGSLYMSPELALLVGNIFAFIVSPKGRFMLTLVAKNTLADATYEFVFSPDRPLAFRPGQYLEWTLENRKSDTRGNRRFFTIASSPTEKTVCLGVKLSTPGSSFKRALFGMQIHEVLSASHIAGDFTLPHDKKKKIVCIAGGIGVTPFRSMVRYLIDTKDARPITLLYSNRTAAEIAYRGLFEEAAQKIGMKTIYALTAERNLMPGIYSGYIDSALIAREVPDYEECAFYLSGPHGMVVAFEKTLHDMGVSRFNVKTDYFPGYA